MIERLTALDAALAAAQDEVGRAHDLLDAADIPPGTLAERIVALHKRAVEAERGRDEARATLDEERRGVRPWRNER